MEIYVKFILLSYFIFCSCQSRFYHVHWFYPYLSFKHSKWRRHKL